MSTTKRENIGWTLREYLSKIGVMLVTIFVGLWCGWNDSYTSFYVAVLVQAINNIYDAYAYFDGYAIFVTVFQVISFLGALGSVIVALLFFASTGSVGASLTWVLGIGVALSVPVVHFGIEVYCMLRDKRY